MLISIVIPVFNVEIFISECLQSVIRQTYTGPLECIVVDDCGTDKSIEIAEQLIAEYDGPIDFKVLHHDHNRGLSAARNTGMDAAKGDYVYFLDSDDWISDDCIEKLAKPLQNEVFDVVVGDFVIVGELPYRLELSLPEGPYHEMGISKTFCNQGVYVMAWNKLYSKEFLKRNRLRFEEGMVHEDEILAFEISCIDKSFYVVKSESYYYRIRENSISTNTVFKQKLVGEVGEIQCLKEKSKQYGKIEGIYDFYLFWIRIVFWRISLLELDDGMEEYVWNHTKGFMNIVPSVCCMKNKHNRLLYVVCRKDQTYQRYLYVTNEYGNTLWCRVLRNLLNLLPYRVN